jgi:hypothetical protein
MISLWWSDGHKKSVPDLTPERDQLNPDQSHAHDLSLTIFLRDGEDFFKPSPLEPVV